MTKDVTGNSLIKEKSPYLLQHARNPVQWYPWGDEAFSRAREEDKPIFLSIGYSTCHWCHVMAHESFEDPDVAELLNQGFISIKVDREERPDIDHLYMGVCQAMTGSGGWPLTIITTPDREPFFAGTYIPKNARYGMMGLTDLLAKVRELWDGDRDRLHRTAQEIVARMNRRDRNAGENLREPDPSDVRAGFTSLEHSFDEVYGGFGEAPKFPSPHNLLFLLRYWKRSGEEKALGMVERTLRNMRDGGMYDHIGFGFHRYSTDRQWLVPHFEKMLYDQALMAMAYTEAYQATGDPAYRDTVEEIFDYVRRVMTHPEGGFYSAEDADSEGVEGKFYVWSMEEIEKILDPKEVVMTGTLYSLSETGNFNDPHRPREHGDNILHITSPIRTFLKGDSIASTTMRESLGIIRESFFREREKRVHPGKDDKILTDWNGLMIAALAKAARVLGVEAYATAAGRAVEFILANLRNGEGRLRHRYRDGDADFPGNLDDHTFLVWGLLELYLTTFRVDHLKSALELNLSMIEHFRDEEGGFFFTPDDGEQLIARKKEYYDGAVPSGNSVAVSNLLTLARIVGSPELEELAAAGIRSATRVLIPHPAGFTHMLSGVDLAFAPSQEVVIVGPRKRDDTRKMLRALRDTYLPDTLVILRPVEEEVKEGDEDVTDVPDVLDNLRDYSMLGEKTTAHVCRDRMCMAPTTDIQKMLRSLGVEVDGSENGERNETR